MFGSDYVCARVCLCARLVYRKQRSGSELEYTEKLQQYSKFGGSALAAVMCLCLQS